jgi:hypothetical protein
MAQGAKANALLNTLIEAKQLVFALNAEDAAAQSELLAANSAIQIATAGGSVPQEKYDAVLAASNKAASIRNKLLKANTAAMNAQLNVQMNPNVEAINALATTRYINQNAKAESNTLMAQYNEAKAKEAATYAALGVAKKTLETAAAAFDSAISSGTDLQTIQAARDAMNAAASQVNAANQEQTYAKAALNTAIANSKMSPVANSLVVTQRVNDENVVAGTKVTTEQYKLNLLNAELAKAQAASTAAAAAAATANANLQASLATATPQEMEELRSLATSTAQASTAAQTALGNKNTSVLEQTAVVQTATAAFQATQDAVVANNIATFLLFNGFVFQQSVDRYVLNPSVLPASVTPGVAIPLDSITIMPLDLGAYDSTAQYTLGNVVSYPDFNGARYTCLVSSQDPRGASYTSITNKDPSAFPTLWVQKEGPSLRYNATTDLLIPTPSVQGATLNVGIASGQMQGMQTLFTNSDINGNNTLLHGLTMFGPGLPSSTLIYPVTITLTGYTNSRANLTMTASNTLVTVSETTSVDYPLTLTATGQGGAIIHSPNSVTVTITNSVDSSETYDVFNNSISFSCKPGAVTSTQYEAGMFLNDSTLGTTHGFNFFPGQLCATSISNGVFEMGTRVNYTPGQTVRISFEGSQVTYYLDSTVLRTITNYTRNVKLSIYDNTLAPLRIDEIKAYSSQTQMKNIYIKNGKTILSAAVLAYNAYVANLATTGFLPDMRPGHLTESFIDTTKLPGTITAGTPFALGSTTITPTDKGLYSASASYTTGDIVSDIYTSKYICLVGPRISGVPYTITDTSPVETPGTSIYWKVIDNKSWSTLTYDASTDLQLEVTGFATNSLLLTSSNNPPNTAVQLDSNFLQGFTLFGTGITQRTMVTSFAYDFAGTTYSYKLNLGAATSTDSTKTFYVKNAASQLSTAVASKLTATLALYMNNAATNALAVLNSTTDAEATTNYNAIVNPGLATLASLYASNSTFMSYINVATTIANLCLSAANTQKQLLALRNNGTISASDYNAAKASNTTTLTNIQTQVSSAASSIAAQDAATANTNVALITAEQANVIADPTVKVYLLASDYTSGSTTWNDKSGNGRNATLEAGTRAKNSAGNAIVLNGSTSWTFPSAAAGNAWTISVWYKNTMATNGITASSAIVSQLNNAICINIAIGDVNGNQLNLGFNNAGWRVGSDLSSYFTQNTWVHLLGTWNGTNLLTYINGSLINSTTHAMNAADGLVNYRIGRRWDGGSFVTGEIGEVRIFSRALNTTEITNTYMENFSTIVGLPTTPTNLTGSIITESAFTVFWSGGDNATSYTYTIDGVATTPTTDSGTTSKSAVFSGLSPLTAYTVVVTATNPLASESSTSVTITTIRNLSLKAGLQIWLDGNDQYSMTITGTNTVTAWNDKSGFNNNTTSAVGTPTVSLTHGMVFNGSSYFNLPNGSIPFGDSSYSIYAVFSFSSIPSNYVVISGGTNTSFGGVCIRSATSKMSYGWYGPFVQGNTNDTISSGTRYMTNTHYLSGGNTGYGYLNGNTQPTFPIGNPRVQPNTNNFIANSPFGIMAGTISEILVYNTSHTTTQRQSVEGYLAWKWGLQTTLPSNHPYLNSAPPVNTTPNLYVYLRATNYSGSGTWFDESANGSDATLENGVIAKNAQGNGIVLNGSTNWIFPNIALGNSWTASIWFKETGPQVGGACILSQIYPPFVNLCLGYDLESERGAYSFGFVSNFFPNSTGFMFTNNTWTNVQATYDGVNVKTYVNGVLIGTSPNVGGTAVDGGTSYRIGRRWDSPLYVTGEIGEVRIYKNALSADELSAIYNESLSTFSS